MLKLTSTYITFVSLIFLLQSCFEEKLKDSSASSDNHETKIQGTKEEDCDDEAAQKTMEKLKTEEYSLINQNDAGCSTEESKAVEIPTVSATALPK